MAKAKKKSKSKSSAAKAKPKAQVDAAAANRTTAPATTAPAKATPAKTTPAKTTPAKSGKSAKGSDKNAKKSTKKSKQKKPNIFKRFANYIRNVRLEVKRTTWPTRNEVLNMTIIVIVALIFFGVLIFIVDQIMIIVVDLISGLRLGANAASLTGAEGAKGILPALTDILTGGK